VCGGGVAVRVLAVVAVGAVLLAGCSNGSAPAAAPSSTSASPSASATPTATTAQYASLVARSQVAASMAKFHDEDCRVGFAIGFTSDLDWITCVAIVDAIGSRAGLLDSTLHVARSVDDPAFVGVPPAEILELVTSTQAKAAAVKSAAAPLDSCGKNCAQAGADFGFALSDLQSELDGWKPYGG
jgi:hypothetical protein